ncbi:MAG: YqgE/AlgH family protein, partial [Flavobacteriaceae bacterium]
MKPANFLIATPTIIGDYNFHRAAVLIVDCKTSGELGFIVNKKMPYTLNELVEEVHNPFPVYFGGPVEQDNLFFIHRFGNQIPDSIRLQEDLFWGGDFQTVISLIESKKITPDQIRFFLG